MRKKSLVKLFLALMTVAILTLFLNGCIIIFDDSPTVAINIVNDNYKYDIRVDGVYVGSTDNNGKLTLSSISTGYHHFEAFDTSFLGRYGDKNQTIINGYNTVNIYTY